MAASTIRFMDSIVLFLIFSFSAGALIAAISVMGYGILLESALPVAALGGLSAGCLGLFFTRLLDRVLPRAKAERSAPAAPASKRKHGLSISNEMERAGRSITAG